MDDENRNGRDSPDQQGHSSDASAPESSPTHTPPPSLTEIKEITSAISVGIRDLEERHPGALDRVMTRWERIHDHNERVDNGLLEIDREDMRRSHRQSEWALGIVAFLALTFLVGGVVVALNASATAGVTLALGGVTITLGGAALFAIGSGKR